MNTINLKLINNSNEQNNAEIVICNTNKDIAVAWRVIKNLGKGDYHPFTFPLQNQISASDSWGNYTPAFNAENGQLFEVVKEPSGNVLKFSGKNTDPNSIALVNNLSNGVVNAYILKDNKTFIQATNLAPQMKASFETHPKIYIGVVSQIEEGQVMNSAILSNINTEISLLGIQSADIVMTGGGVGPNATPFKFTLENVVNA